MSLAERHDLRRGHHPEQPRPESPFTIETDTYLPNIAATTFLPGRTVDTVSLAQESYGRDSRYVERRLGTNTLYEMDENLELFVPSVMAINLLDETEKMPDAVYVVTSHLPENRQKRGNQLAEQVRDDMVAFAHGTRKNGKVPLVAKDVSAACSTFGVLQDAVSHLPDGANVMVLVDETQYRRTLPNPEDDKGYSRLLFSDIGAGMQFVKGPEGLEILSSQVNHEPDVAGSLKMRVPAIVADNKYQFYVPHGDHFAMDGPAVKAFFSGKINTETILAHLQESDVDPEQLKFLVPHQASRVMLDYVHAQFPHDEFPNLRYISDTITKYGNTSAASGPLGLIEGLKNGAIESGDTGMTVYFGGGFTWTMGAVRVN